MTAAEGPVFGIVDEAAAGVEAVDGCEVLPDELALLSDGVELGAGVDV